MTQSLPTFIDTLGLVTHRHHRIKYIPKYVQVKQHEDSTYIKFSSKLWMQRNIIPRITKFNFSMYLSELDEMFDQFTLVEFFDAQVYYVDISKDIYNDTGLTNEEFINRCRLLAIKNSNKTEAITYDCNYKYEPSLSLRSAVKSIKDSLSIYPKVAEIKNNRNDTKYYNNFYSDFFIRNANLLRFERRLQKAPALRRAFGIQNPQPVTVKDVLLCERDLLAERVEELLLGGKTCQN